MGKQIESVAILGVRVDKVTMDQAVDLVEDWLQGRSKQYIVTTNPEFVMAAQEDPEFKRILNESDLSIADGVGLKLASDTLCTISGVDLLEELCKLSEKNGFTTGFLGGRNGVAKEAAECLQKRYPGLKVAFAEDGPLVDMQGNVVSSHAPYAISPCDILFVAFGQVKQEKWIVNNLPRIPVGVAMGVGGSFDEISGRVPRIPKWVHHLGLKWLVRLILQPWRIKRQLALVRFVWNVLH